MTHALIIDDDAGNLGVLEQMLTMQGIDYTAIQDTTRVEALLPTLPPVNLLILDLEMPDIDGYQMLQILKAQPQFNGVPIVACTVHTNELHTARELGFDSFISKPLNVNRFPEQLQKILEGSAVWEAR